jgi:tetratricopeptide (TPR) repeat protein
MKMKVINKMLLLALLVFSAGTQAAAFNPENRFDALLQQDEKQSKYGEDSVTCVINISLYREFYKQWKASDQTSQSIKEVFKPWRWVFNNCPLGSENIYVDGVNIYQYRIENEKDKAKKEKYIDTLMMIYDQRVEYFPDHYKTGKSQVGAILGRKGIDLYTYAQDRYEDTYNTLKKSVELDGNAADGSVLIYYFRSVIKMAKKSKIDSTAIVDVYDKAIDILDYNIKGLEAAGDTRWAEIYKNFKGNIDATFEPFATCEDLVKLFNKKYKANPSDVNLLKKITTMLDKRDCTSDPLYLNASVKLHELEPSPESAYLIGRLMIKDEKYNKAIPYLEQATSSSDIERAHNAYKLLAEVQRANKNYPRSRQMALKALELDPKDGAPYITIGDLYASSAKQCGDNEFTSRVAYWAAIDKYEQAKRIDPSVAETANKRIADYRVYFPSLETIFFYDYKEGDPYTIECWFTETTTIRAAK